MTGLKHPKMAKPATPSIAANISHTKAQGASDSYHLAPRLGVDIGDVSPAEDDADLSETCSNYSSVSEDSLPPIHAYSHRYHGSGQVMTPNDESEALRLSWQHELFQLCLDGDLVDAKLPLEDYTPENPLEILGVGTGTGAWACDMAQRYPQVNILGVDLTSALLPNDVPANTTFEIADVTEPWPSKYYDFIHIRNLVGGGIRDWKAFLDEAYAHLKPGGQLEFTEIRPRFFDVEPESINLKPQTGQKPTVGAACREFEMTYALMCMKLGLDFDPVPRVSTWLTEIGAESIRERVDWLPVQSWGHDHVSRKKGELLGKMIEYGMENWTLMLFGRCGWEEEETRALLERVNEEVANPSLRSNAKVTFITARKPLVRPASIDDSTNAATSDVEEE